MTTIAVVPGDDASPEAVLASMRVLDAMELGFDFDVLPNGTELAGMDPRERDTFVIDRLDAAEQHTWFRLAALYHFRLASRALVPTLLDLASLGDRSHSTVDQR